VTQSFEKTERFLDALLADLSSTLSSTERAEVVEFIDVGEYGIALETLVALIVEEHKQISLPIFQRIIALAESMGLRETIPIVALRRQVKAR